MVVKHMISQRLHMQIIYVVVVVVPSEMGSSHFPFHFLNVFIYLFLEFIKLQS